MYGEITISGFASYVPAGRRTNKALITSENISEKFLDEKIGVKVVPIKSEDEETSDLAVKAAQRLFEKLNINPSKIDCLVLCTQNPDSQGLPHCSVLVHKKLGLTSGCATFDISLGCSGFVHGVNIVSSFASANQLKNVVFITADPYSKVVNVQDKNTSLLFGDAACATLLQHKIEKTSGGLRHLASSFVTESRKSSSLRVNDDLFLEMNGRDVFNFAATKVPEQVVELLRANGLLKEQISAFYFHQGSKYILTTLTERLDLDPLAVKSNLSEYGNTVSSSIPLLLEENWETIKSGDIVLLCGFGVGLTSACSILKME